MPEDLSEPTRRYARPLLGTLLIVTVAIPLTAVVLRGMAEREAETRLRQQLWDVRANAHRHITAAKGLTRYQFSSVTIATCAGVVAGVLLLILSGSGWRNADPRLVAAFFGAFAVATVFTVSNQLYGHQQGVERNSELYLAFIALEDRMLTFSTGKLGTDTAAFLARVDSMVAELREIAVYVDSGSIPDPRDISRSLAESVGGS